MHQHGDIINGFPYLPPDKRKKILLLSDDLRMSSGVGTVSREIILSTAHYFNWVQVAGAIQHPDVGKRVDLSKAVADEIGIPDASVILFPTNGYGTIEFIRQIVKYEKIDALMPYTDPRFWVWLFNHEHELRQKLPMFFYHVWDDVPFPKYNEAFYESCDWIGCISKQTYNIVKNVWKTHPPKDWQVSYIPHGIPEHIFYPISETSPGKLHKVPSGKKIKIENNQEIDELIEKSDLEIMKDTRARLFGENQPEFVLLYVNRNVRRKMTADIILAYKKFCDELPPEKAAKCALLMHTAVRDEAGTDLQAVVEDLGVKHRVIFSESRIEPKFMNIIFNIADVTINISSNEGFGLGTAESLMAGTPIIVNVTGGLQDQCGFKKADGTYLTVDDFNETFQSNHEGVYKEHGGWVKPIFPATISCQGSIPTPYIYDDRCRWQDVATLIREWYDVGRDERKRCGQLGREYVTTPAIGMSSSEMGRRFIHDINTAFSNWTPRKRFSFFKV